MRRSTCHTSLAAAMATAAELSRRGYDVAFTLGNTPKVDLLCSLPGGHAFKVQVKGVSHRSGPYIQTSFFKEPAEPMLFLVVVFVPPLGREADPLRFFVLSHQQATDAWKEMPATRRDGTPYTEEDGDGLNWGSITPYEGKWNIFPHPSAAVPEPILQAIERHFHSVIRERAANLGDEHHLSLPSLTPSLFAVEPAWFPIPGMFGGFSYRLEGEGEGTKLISESWSRVVGGSAQRHEITAEGALLVAEGFDEAGFEVVGPSEQFTPVDHPKSPDYALGQIARKSGGERDVNKSIAWLDGWDAMESTLSGE